MVHQLREVDLYTGKRVVAARELRRGAGVVIRNGTPGTVIDHMAWLGRYSVEFRPCDAGETRVTVNDLIKSDFRFR